MFVFMMLFCSATTKTCLLFRDSAQSYVMYVLIWTPVTFSADTPSLNKLQLQFSW